MKKNRIYTAAGAVAGILFPFVVMFILYHVQYSNVAIQEFLRRLFVSQLFFPVLSICVLPNLILFFIFIWTHRYFSARGVLGATLFYALLVLVFRLFY
jgi:hypothetical protein